MWRYYLLSCAGAFRARDIQLWQWVLSKEGVPDGYRRVGAAPARSGKQTHLTACRGAADLRVDPQST